MSTIVEKPVSKILNVPIEEEMVHSYIDYAMSVIVSRALPDVRDGLKPVQRRILYAMGELGMNPDKPHKKSARIVGEVLGKYHPHGDSAVYDAMVRLAQNFSTRYLLVDGHGNFGSIDGDPPAAMRYTEARLTRIARELLSDLDKDTVDWAANFDDSLQEPVVLPAAFPNLMVNGSSGIAVGMATNIPPHNLGEVIDGLMMLIKNPWATNEDLMEIIKGPDFPTGGIVMGKDGINEAYSTGRGIITLRANAEIETTSSGRSRIVVTELPYQVNKARLIENIARLVREKKIDGVSELKDESDKSGMRIVIDVRRDANASSVLNRLYKHTTMQTSFGIIMLALVKGKPETLCLKDCLYHYIEHRRDVVTRRTRYLLRVAEERAHILEGLRIALSNIDRVIQLIRSSATTDIAREGLISEFDLSLKQAQAILDMRLQRLTGLERDKIEEEYQEIKKDIEYYYAVLRDEHLVDQIITKELTEIRSRYADQRKSKIVESLPEWDMVDLIPEEDVVVTLTRQGYIKRIAISTYRTQHRGGRGITGIATREEDFVEHLFTTTTHHHMLFFTNDGKVYRVMVYEIPDAGRQAKGLAVANLIPITSKESITAIIPMKSGNNAEHLFFATKNGTVKKTDFSDFENIQKNGKIAIDLLEDDELIGVHLTKEGDQVFLTTRKGLAIRFPEEGVRSMGRAARGVRGIRLGSGDAVVAMDVIPAGEEDHLEVLSVTKNGFGKRTPLKYHRVQSRGGKGVRSIRLSKRNGQLVTMKVLRNDDELMIITQAGIIIRITVNDISQSQRDTQGVRLIRLDKGDAVAAVALVVQKEIE